MHTIQAFLIGALSSFVLVTTLIFLGLSFAEEVTINDKDWRVKERIRDGAIYDREWRVKGQIKDGKVHDKGTTK